MNREERRHPDKQPQHHEDTKAPQEQDLQGQERTQDDASVRAKNSRHKKVTADKWNQ